MGDIILTPDTNSDIFKKEKNWQLGEKDTAGHGGSTWKRWKSIKEIKNEKIYIGYL
ncbi:hypothetical protein [Fusobacterium varium]|uniref:hypothetical protein n=1 Tax=Fusobacterium varium TaxID=856 RepID=UPI00303173D9